MDWNQYLKKGLEEQISIIFKFCKSISDANTRINDLKNQILKFKTQMKIKETDLKEYANKVRVLEGQVSSLHQQVKEIQNQFADRDEVLKRVALLQNSLQCLR